MKDTKTLVCIMGTLFMLSACASPREPVKPVAVAAPPASPPLIAVNKDAGSTVERIVIYAERLRWIAPALLDNERIVAEREYKSDPNAYNRLRLALLLTLPRAPFRNDARGRQLLSETAREPGSDNQALRSLAVLWLQDLDERWTAERMLDEERRQRQVLQKKLDQLRAIEEEMGRREPPPVMAPTR